MKSRFSGTSVDLLEEQDLDVIFTALKNEILKWDDKSITPA